LGDFEQAKAALLNIKDKAAEKILNLASELAARKRQIASLKAAKKFDAAIKEVEKMIELGANRDLLVLEKMQISYLSGNFYQVVSDAMGLLKKDSSNTEALVIRAKAFYQLGELEGCLNHLKQCVRVQPDHKECGDEFKRISAIVDKRDAALKLYKNNQFTASFGPLKEAIEVVKDIPPVLLELSVALCEAYNKGST
jgi:tetratricopeptide (TPR) repeat protein